MTAFVSQLETIIPAEEVLESCGSTSYRSLLKHSVTHPAKMHLGLLEYLIKRFTKPNHIVLDPMSGTGSMGIVASLNGRNAVQVDVERKFFDWAEQAKKSVESLPSWVERGKITNICGDSRNLSSLLGSVIDSVVTSPPYSEGIGHEAGPNANEEHSDRLEMQRRYTESMNSNGNIGQLKHGKIDAVITSPPYADGSKGKSRQPLYEKLSKDPTSNRYARKSHPTIDEGYGPSKENIGNLSFVNAVITSPPYSDSMNTHSNPIKSWSEEAKQKWYKSYKASGGGQSYEEFIQYQEEKQTYQYSDNRENIGKLKHGKVDAMITSPPYGEAQSGIAKRGYRQGKRKPSPSDIKLPTRTYASDKFGENNISRQKGESYLEAMLKVYGEIYKVLKPARLICNCSTQNDYGQTLPSGIFRRRGLHRDTPSRSANNNRAEDEGSLRPDQAILGSDGLYSDPHLHIPLEVTANWRRQGDHLQIAGDKLSRHLDHSERSFPVSNSKENSSNRSIKESTREKAEHGISERGKCSQITPTGIGLYSNKQVLSMHQQEDTNNTSQAWDNRQRGNQVEGKGSIYLSSQETHRRELGAICPSCQTAYRYDGGTAIIVVKPFIRNKVVVDLPYHTWLLLQKVGFALSNVLKFRLPHQSFWRILQYKKYPNLPKLKHEYILVVRK